MESKSIVTVSIGDTANIMGAENDSPLHLEREQTSKDHITLVSIGGCESSTKAECPPTTRMSEGI